MFKKTFLGLKNDGYGAEDILIAILMQQLTKSKTSSREVKKVRLTIMKNSTDAISTASPRQV